MTIGKRIRAALKYGRFAAGKPRMVMTLGQSLRIIRDLQELTQTELAKISGLPQSTISGMKSGRITIGVKWAKAVARALRVHPAVIVFPGWDVEHAS